MAEILNEFWTIPRGRRATISALIFFFFFTLVEVTTFIQR